MKASSREDIGCLAILFRPAVQGNLITFLRQSFISMKLLIIGGTGLLGQYLVLEASQRGMDVIATYHDNDAKIGTRTLVHMDVRDEAEVNEVVRSSAPQAVVHAAGITDLDRCENNPQEAWGGERRGVQRGVSMQRRPASP